MKKAVTSYLDSTPNNVFDVVVIKPINTDELFKNRKRLLELAT